MFRGPAGGPRGPGRNADGRRAPGPGTISVTVTNEVFRYVLSAEGREIDLLGRRGDARPQPDVDRPPRARVRLALARAPHARIAARPIVKDLNSSNGTYVGGKRISRETRLQSGDRVQLGAAVIDLRIVRAERAHPIARRSSRPTRFRPSRPPLRRRGRPPASRSSRFPAPRTRAPRPRRLGARAGPDVGLGALPGRRQERPRARGGPGVPARPSRGSSAARRRLDRRAAARRRPRAAAALRFGGRRRESWRTSRSR